MYWMKKISTLLFCILWATTIFSQTNREIQSMADDQVLLAIAKHQPLNGAKIPSNIKDQLGATHVAGKYFFTNEPYLIEGCKKMSELGYGVVKLWFRKTGSGYPYNSNWNINKDISLVDLAKHPYWQTCFDMPFSTIALSIEGAGIRTTDASAKAEEDEIYALTKYLLEKYKDRELTFIFHN